MQKTKKKILFKLSTFPSKLPIVDYFYQTIIFIAHETTKNYFARIKL